MPEHLKHLKATCYPSVPQTHCSKLYIYKAIKTKKQLEILLDFFAALLQPLCYAIMVSGGFTLAVEGLDSDSIMRGLRA